MKPVILSPGIGDDRPTATLYYGQDVRDTLRTLPEASVHTVCTSPPYFGLRDYGKDGQIGLEATPEEFVTALVEVFREVKRVLRPDGTLWVNLGDSYWSDTLARKTPVESMWGNRPASDLRGGRSAIPTHNKRGGIGQRPAGVKPKDLMGIPWRVALALQADGWYLRQDIVWSKPNPMPEAVRDRCTKSHEYVFLLAHPDSEGKYYYDHVAIKEPYASADPSSISYRKNGKSDSRKKHSIYCPACDGSGDETDENGDDCQVCGGTGRADIGMSKPAVKNDGFWKPEGTGRNKRSVWTVNVAPYQGAHFATWPPELVRPMILAGCPVGGTVLDVFSGSGTTGMVALQEGRNYIGTDLNSEYLPLAEARIREERPPDNATEESDDGVLGMFGCNE